MKLITKKIRKELPSLYSTEGDTDPLLRVKFFTPDDSMTWYGIEFDGDDIFFGLIVGMETELGYFKLSELQRVRGSLNLPVERDMYFTPIRLSVIHPTQKTRAEEEN